MRMTVIAEGHRGACVVGPPEGYLLPARRRWGTLPCGGGGRRHAACAPFRGVFPGQLVHVATLLLFPTLCLVALVNSVPG
jgi:hypothetical protein